MWLTETPWPPAIVLLVAVVVLGLVWRRNGRTLFLALAAGCLLLIPIVFLVEEAIVTPAEEVEQQIYAIRDAVIRDDVKATLDFLSSTAVREKALVATAMAVGHVQPDARITDVSIDVKGGGTVATSHFRANGVFTGNGVLVSGDHRFPTRWRATWRKEAGRWKIFALERLDPITGEPIGLMDPG
ncbi:MAG: nuclear transport factor 2 family protein [Planctomycetaceae bacterium]